MLERSRPSPTVFAGLLLPLLAACPGTLPEPPSNYRDGGGVTGTGGATGAGGATGGCDAPTMYFAKVAGAGACGAMGCHSASDLLDLASTGVWDRLFNKPEVESPMCDGMLLVNPTKPPAGVLFQRLVGSTCGIVMPYGFMDQAAKDCITSWVEARLP